MTTQKGTGKLAGKRAVITGSTDGVGKATALLLAQEGASVVINGRGTNADGQADSSRIDAVVNTITEAGGNASGFAGSVAEQSNAEGLIAHCVDQFGGIDILINNAGMAVGFSVEDCPPELWLETLNTNLNSMYYCSHFAAPHMKRQHWGRILNATSFAASGKNGGAAYAASKGGMLSLSNAMAHELGMFGITSNAYSPEARTTMTDVGMGDEIFVPYITSVYQRGWIDKGRLDELSTMPGPEGVAPFIAYLCLDEANYISGRHFYVEARRIGLMPDFDEITTVYPQTNKAGVASLDALCESMPKTFGVQLRNRFGPRSKEEIAKLYQQVPELFMPSKES